MMTSKARLGVVVLALILLAYTVYAKTYQLTALMACLIGYTIWSYYRDGTVLLASEAFKKKQYDQARSLLADIKNPNYLRKKRRNYYEFISGNLDLQLLDYESAERHFQIASLLPFRRKSDKALIFVNLANLNLRKKDYDRVKVYLEKVKELDVSSRIMQIVNRIENEIPK
jgi:predicted negative regulator of RcsB-dependent stress response